MLARSLLCIISALLILACQNNDNKPCHESELRLNMGEAVTNFDPRQTTSLCERAVCQQLYSGLSKMEANNQCVLELAKDYKISPDGLTYTFFLREALWSDGSSITAHDFERSWKGALEPSFPGNHANMLYVIVGAESAKKGLIPTSEVAVKALDERTLQVQLQAPTPYFLSLTAQAIYAPYKEGSPVYSGPFVLQEEKADEVRLKKNPKYWRAASCHLDRLTLTWVSSETELALLEAGTLDWAGSPYSDLPLDRIPELKANSRLSLSPALQVRFIRLNTTRPHLANLNLRRALCLAIDRESLVNTFLHGVHEPAFGFVPKCLGGTNAFFPDHAITTAKEALEAARATLGTIPPIHIMAAEGPNLKMAELLQALWTNTLGLDVRIDRTEPKIGMQRAKALDYEISVSGWVGDFMDPINFLEIFQHKNGGTNRTGWYNADYDTLLRQASTLQAGVERQQCFFDAERILMDELPIIPLYFCNYCYANNPKWEGIAVTELGDLDFRQAKLKS